MMIPMLWPKKGSQRDQKRQLGQDEEEVGRAHEEGVEPTAEVARHEADAGADDHGHGRGREPDDERYVSSSRNSRNRSRPSSSVPNQCAAEGPISIATDVEAVMALNGNTSGPTTAISTTSQQGPSTRHARTSRCGASARTQLAHSRHLRAGAPRARRPRQHAQPDRLGHLSQLGQHQASLTRGSSAWYNRWLKLTSQDHDREDEEGRFNNGVVAVRRQRCRSKARPARRTPTWTGSRRPPPAR